MCIVSVSNLIDFSGLLVCKESAHMLGGGRIGGLACEPVVLDTTGHKCSNRAYFNTGTRSLDAAALHINMESALRERQLEEYGW